MDSPLHIQLQHDKDRAFCDVPITKEQWTEFLHDKSLIGPLWRNALLAFYYMPKHQATCKQCAEKFGGNANTYNSAVTAMGKTIIDKLGTFIIVDNDGKEKLWPVVMGEGKIVKGTSGVYQWTLRPELVEALREYIIEDALQQYEADFASNWKREDYKWKALKTFHDNWNIDATDFAAMLNRAFSKHKNLLDTSRAYPKSALIESAQKKPEIVRQMMRELYDETLPLVERITNFLKKADEEFEYDGGRNHFQSTNAVSVYLWFRYPEKYYIYKWSEDVAVCKKLALPNAPKATGKPSELIKAYDMHKLLDKHLANDTTLLDLYNNILEETADTSYNPEGLATLTDDFGFWISRYYKPLIAESRNRVWFYAPGEGAALWDDCQENSVMSLGWDEVSDLSQYSTKKELDAAVDAAYPQSDTNLSNSKRCLWDFAETITPGDIVYAKKGVTKIIGRGIVESDYIFDETRQLHHHVRKVNWTHIGEWDAKEILGNQLPQITMSELSDDQFKKIEDAIVNGVKPATAEEPQPEYNDGLNYWWLVASPKYWRFADLKVGDAVEYTVKNDKGNKRRVPANFENAKVGDIVIGYEANPAKKIVALAKVVKASDGETISYEKTETLDVPIPWADFKDKDELREMEFIKNNNGSFFKLTPEEYQFVMELIRRENPEPDDDANSIVVNAEKYTVDQFLSEVFMTKENLDDLVHLLKLKKNVILQGAPGVGKTFSAKRLAYCMMEVKDDSRIEMVQFHQNYSYEDFIMGYRPTENGGFKLEEGSFYKFCKKAENNRGKEYFFIIDEINRGNLSKIFGELLMLIENSYRGHAIRLAYRDEQFSVPTNVYIIGMMNTADRSLAMIDYALRRRFSFHSMVPGFDTDGFKAEIAKHPDERVARVVEAVKQLNDTIAKDDSLGNGFCVGHSYFCDQPTDKPWIEQVVRYDICPMLDEYWFDSADKCESEKKRLLDLLK